MSATHRLPSLARFCDCKVWLAREPDPASYVFFGFDTDTTLATYLFSVVDRAIRVEVRSFRAGRPDLAGLQLRQACSSFQLGMASRVAERLDALHAEREATVMAQRPTGPALVLLRHQVVEQAFRENSPRLRSLPGLSVRRNAAYRAGRTAGEGVNLRRPLQAAEQDLLEP